MKCEVTAYVIGETRDWGLQPADTKRDWMDKTVNKAAYRCLPLTIANQAGWVITNPVRFAATWNGKAGVDALKLEFPEQGDYYRHRIVSSFGSGIISFFLPWLFRTNDGIGLQVRGPTNYFKPDVAPLDGLVETDWAPSTFTMNWRVMKQNAQVWFRKGEPICMLTPFPLALLDDCTARTASIETNPRVNRDFEQWKQTRREQFSDGAFRLDYVRGRKPDGSVAEAHLTTVKLPKFTEGAVTS